MSPYNPKSAYTPEQAREAQAKRKTRGTGAYLKQLKETDPEAFKKLLEENRAKVGRNEKGQFISKKK